jgi:hypothetical protein
MVPARRVVSTYETEKTMKTMTLGLALGVAQLLGCGDSKTPNQPPAAAQETAARQALATLPPLSKLFTGEAQFTPMGAQMDPISVASCAVKSVTGRATTYTFNCTENGETLTGTATQDGDHYVIDIHVRGTINVDESANLTYSESADGRSIEGKFKSDVTGPGIEAHEDLTLTGVREDAKGCATAGALSGEMSVRTQSEPVQTVTLNVQFSATCS